MLEVGEGQEPGCEAYRLPEGLQEKVKLQQTIRAKLAELEREEPDQMHLLRNRKKEYGPCYLQVTLVVPKPTWRSFCTRGLPITSGNPIVERHSPFGHFISGRNHR
jgi:hypothetical protein